MYHYYLLFHSYFRWAAILSLLFQLIWIGWNAWQKKTFTKRDYNLMLVLVIIYDIQLVLGWLLFFESPLVSAFWNDVGTQVKNRQLRFFGLEHMSMMTLGIMLINFYSFKAINMIGTTAFGYLWKRFVWIGLIMLASIPWSFSPLTSRPNWR